MATTMVVSQDTRRKLDEMHPDSRGAHRVASEWFHHIQMSGLLLVER